MDIPGRTHATSSMAADTETRGAARKDMVRRQMRDRGIRDEAVLRAMERVPREAFLPADLAEFAYEDSPLPIAAGQTISQPYIVAYMTDALQLQGGEKVLEIGTGSGYAAAVLAEIAGEVWTIERFETLAAEAKRALEDAGYDDVNVVVGDGTRGCPAQAPFDAIVVAAGGPRVPDSLREQLKIGGRLVIPVGADPRTQELIRVTRTGATQWREESLADVRFVPLVGEEGWDTESPRRRPPAVEVPLPELVSRHGEPFDTIEDANLDALLERIGNARVVLLGEATHGTSEFYRMRARITAELVTRKGFDAVAVEADWPDAARIDRYVRPDGSEPATLSSWTAFSRFPTWMWRNRDVREFVDWLYDHNDHRATPNDRVGFYGLDLYSMYTSIAEVLRYLDDVDPEAAAMARERYACLAPFSYDPASYGAAALRGRFTDCERGVVATLGRLLEKRLEYTRQDGDAFLDAAANARLVTNAERYYKTMYYGGVASWNLRDSHMFETLLAILEHRGPRSKVVVWEHNSHLGDARFTEMAARGEHNVGQLCREHFGSQMYSIGFGTHTGTVAAARNWGDDMKVVTVRESHPESYEFVFHRAEPSNLLLPLRHGLSEPAVRQRLAAARLERAIGVIYRPETELASHYFRAILPRQFDEFCWFDETRAVEPLPSKELTDIPDTYPFGL